MTKITSLLILAISICNITAQDLIERLQQGIVTQSSVITTESSMLAQKFINTDSKDLAVRDFFKFKAVDNLRQSVLSKSVDNAVVFDFKESGFEAYTKAGIYEDQMILRIPVDEEHFFDLMLEKGEVLDKNFRLVTSGEGRIDYKPKGAFYNGIIAGIPESFATVSLSGDRIEIIASDPSGNYVITEIKGSQSEYILYNDFKLKEESNFSCGNTDEEFVLPDNFDPTDDTSKKAVRSNVEVYVEVDYDMYVDHGNSTSATMNYVLDVFRASVSVFEKEQISLRLNKVKIWTTANDPFNGITGIDDLDDALSDWACEGFDDADIAHYIGAGSLLVGKANGIGEFCDQEDSLFCGDDDTSHCASLGMDSPFIEIDGTATANLGYSVPTWELYLFCHEMGHVFGSPHTHACEWNGNGTQIDDCGNVTAFNNGDSTPSCFNSNSPIIPSNGGTMMSYCHQSSTSIDVNLSLGFGSQPGNLIRSVINNSSCIDTYELFCPEVETIESTVATNGTFDAKKEILIHDSSITTGFDPTFTGGEKVDIYGNWEVPAGANFRITNTGCN